MLIIKGHLGTKSLIGEDPSTLNVPKKVVIPNYPCNLFFCAKEMIEGIQRVTERRGDDQMPYRNANGLKM